MPALPSSTRGTEWSGQRRKSGGPSRKAQDKQAAALQSKPKTHPQKTRMGHPYCKQKTRERGEPARVGDSENGVPLTGGESSPARPWRTAPLEAGPHEQPDDEGGNRKMHRPSGPFANAQGKRKAEPQPGKTRVRFEFARRAHQREITPKLGINRVARDCQGERAMRREKN